MHLDVLYNRTNETNFPSGQIWHNCYTDNTWVEGILEPGCQLNNTHPVRTIYIYIYIYIYMGRLW